MSSHGGPACAEKGEGERPKTHPFPPAGLHLPKIPEPCKIVHRPGTKLPNTNLWETFPIQLQSPFSLGGFVPLLRSAVMGGYTCPGYHRHHCPAFETPSRCKVSVPREAEAGALVAPSLCYLPSNTSEAWEGRRAGLLHAHPPFPSPRNHLRRHHPLQK